MKLFEVYPLLPITPIKAEGCYIFDDKGDRYLDLYGGHAVISIGHSHPAYVEALSRQVEQLGFYSNSIQNPLQQEYSRKLGKLSGFPKFSLFLVNSGAEAVENALKIASFHNKKDTVLAIKGSFHGRTSLALGVTDNEKIKAAVNQQHKTVFVELNDLQAAKEAFATHKITAVIIEGIQGIAGIYEPTVEFLSELQTLCKENNALLILDEIQSGFGRTGKFFAFQHSNIEPDLITIAKGMGNGFPMGGVLISPSIESRHGMLGTTFGGSHLACAAGMAVLEVMEEEQLIRNASEVGRYLVNELKKFSDVTVRGKGLMIGIEFGFPIKPLRSHLLYEHKIFTGVANNPNTLRLLPPLSLNKSQADYFVTSLEAALKIIKQDEAISFDK